MAATIASSATAAARTNKVPSIFCRANVAEWLTWLWFFLSPVYFVIPFTSRRDFYRRR
jgi:hypothetical protein